MAEALLPELPDPERYHRGNVAVCVNPDYDGPVELDDLFALPSLLESTPGISTRQPARTTCWQWCPPWHAGPGLLVRQYAHGGALGGILGTVFPGSARMVHELRVAAYARRMDVPTARPVAVRLERVFGPFVRAHYVTENVYGTADLLGLCASLGAERPGPARRRRLTGRIAAAVSSMHDAGILHADLNLKNVLVRDAFDEPEVFIIDFDKARLVPGLSLRQRMSNLLRLDRSVVKWQASRRTVTIGDRLRVVLSYLARYPDLRVKRGRIVRRYARRHLLHWFSRERA